MRNAVLMCLIVSLLFSVFTAAGGAVNEIDAVRSPDPSQVIAVQGVRLIDGTGASPVEDATIVVQGNRFIQAGESASVDIPDSAHLVDGRGLTALPGFIDSHFHLGAPRPSNFERPVLWLQHGITSLRDPGAWIAKYDEVRKLDQPMTRLFLTGPHLDNNPPAHPQNAIIVRDAQETRVEVNRMIDRGASAIKVYFRLPLDLIRVAAATAHQRGVPITAHLEIVNAADAIRAGLDGVEHATSFTTALLPPREAEQWRQSMLFDNNARRTIRSHYWSEIDLDSPQARKLYKLIADTGTFLSPTLAVSERRADDEDVTERQVKGFENLLGFVRRAHRAGARIVVGSHGNVSHADFGWSFQHEMELLVECGLSPMEAIVAGTMENARFFRIAERLGSIEPGKIADLVLVRGNPLDDIRVTYDVERVLLNGIWVK